MANGRMKRLNHLNESTFFDQPFHKREVCRYAMSHFLYRDVQKLAERKGVIIDYCRPGTEEYKIYGCNCFIVCSKEQPETINHLNEPVYFDPGRLMI